MVGGALEKEGVRERTRERERWREEEREGGREIESRWILDTVLTLG